MSTHLHVRDLPDHVHAVLRSRARRSGQSLRQYTIEVLADHCAAPTIDEWLEGLGELPEHRLGAPAAEALERAREGVDRPLPDLLASLPSLGDDAADFAHDVDRARQELGESGCATPGRPDRRSVLLKNR
jgi:hypothetical protein